MIVRSHIVLGLIFSILFWTVFPGVELIFILMVFVSSFLIDFDHYVYFVLKTRKFGLGKAFKFYDRLAKIDSAERDRGIRRKGVFMLFHTIEFHILVFLLGYLWVGFFYVFIGLLFHTICDLADLIYRDFLYRREYLLTHWIWGKL